MIFLNSASFAAALVFHLPGVCTHTDTEGKPKEARVQNIYFKIFENTIFNEHPLMKRTDRRGDKVKYRGRLVPKNPLRRCPIHQNLVQQ